VDFQIEFAGQGQGQRSKVIKCIWRRTNSYNCRTRSNS